MDGGEVMSDRYDAYTVLKFERPAPGVLEVIMSNPGRLNSLTAAGHRELTYVWRDIDADPETECVLLRGDGGVYSAGGDMSLVEAIATDWESRVRGWQEAKDLVYNVINFSKPLVAAIEGPAVGAGLAAAMVADITVAGRTARIIDGHTKLGVAAGDHAAIVWPILCGMAKAKYYLMLCDVLTGEEAERIGVVSMCTDDDKVVETALGLCKRLVDMAPMAIRWTKYSLNNWMRAAGPTFDASLALEMLGMAGPEVREGHAAITEKRKPNFPKIHTE
jgi:enoyl-CoA hydratase